MAFSLSVWPPRLLIVSHPATMTIGQAARRQNIGQFWKAVCFAVPLLRYVEHSPETCGLGFIELAWAAYEDGSEEVMGIWKATTTQIVVTVSKDAAMK